MAHSPHEDQQPCFNPVHIIVTGGAGFIGSHLVDLLLETYPLASITIFDAFTYASNIRNLDAALSSGRVTIMNNCITDRSALNQAFKNADAVFHLAAESHVPRSFDEPDLFDRVNHHGAINVTRIAAHCGISRLVHVSTDEVYGPCNEPVKENAVLKPTTPYAISKARAEESILEIKDIDLRIARPVNAVGTRQHSEKLVPRFARLALSRKPFTIEGSGHQQRSFVPVDDLARGLITIMQSDVASGSIFNIAGTDLLSVRDVAKHIADAANVPFSCTQVEDRPVNDPVYSVDGSAIAKLGHRNQSDFDKEVRHVIDETRRTMTTKPEKRFDIGHAAPPLVPQPDNIEGCKDRRVRFHTAWRPGISGPNLQAVLEGERLAGGGAMTTRLETLMASSTGAQAAWLTHSCTGAMEVAALALDIRPGDEVIVPTYTFCATATAFERAGARIIFVDIDPDDFMIDQRSAETRITPRTKAIIAVHYGGNIKDLTCLIEMADRHGVHVIEDAAQAFGSKLSGKPAGRSGVLGCYSFHETKTFSSGQGGLLLLNRHDDKLAGRIEQIINRGTNFSQFRDGLTSHYEWVAPGGSYRPTELEAAILLDCLPDMPEILERRKAISQAYAKSMKAYDLNFQRLMPSALCESNHHIEAIILDTPHEAMELINWLSKSHIEAQSHYKPLHLSRHGQKHDKDADCPVAEDYWQRIVRLPIHTSMSLADVEYVVARIHQWKKSKRRHSGVMGNMTPSFLS